MTLLTPAEVAEILGVHVRTVRRLICAGHLAAIDVSAGTGEAPRWRVDPKAVDAFLASRGSAA